jgi:hypothetical protein
MASTEVIAAASGTKPLLASRQSSVSVALVIALEGIAVGNEN